MNYEHAWGDGIPNLRYMESIYDDMEKSNSVTLDLKPQEGTVDEIKFNLDETCHKYIQKAIRLHEERKSKIETKIRNFSFDQSFSHSALFVPSSAFCSRMLILATSSQSPFWAKERERNSLKHDRAGILTAMILPASKFVPLMQPI